MLRLRTANVLGVLSMVIMLPFLEHVVAMPVAQLAKKFVGPLFGRPVPQWIHANAHRQSRQWIVILRARQYRALIAQPPEIAHKHHYQQHSGAGRNADLGLSKGHRPSLELAMGGT